jgi:ferredoxin-NADP reductase
MRLLSVGPPAWVGLRPFRVADVVRESRQIASFVLEPVDGEPLPAYRPGQYLTVRVRPAGASRALLRNFSLSAAHDTRRYRLSIKREPDGIVTSYLHDNVEPGDVIDVGAPRGMFTLDSAHGQEPVVLLSAGIGATPVLAMLDALTIAGSDRDVWWIHGARSGAEHAFADEVRRHVAALPRARSHIRYSRPAPSDVLGHDYDAEGRVTLEVLHDVGVPREARFYLCGPPPWMRDVASGLLTWGVAPELLLSE